MSLRPTQQARQMSTGAVVMLRKLRVLILGDMAHIIEFTC
jgi:hypothetical protein